MRYAPVPDYHMHTPRCNHASGSMRDYAEAARGAGLTEIGFSDHSPMPADYDPEWRMRREELPDYLAELDETREAFAGRLTIRRGLEADFHPGTEAYVRDMIDAHAWDYVIGSVHYIGDWGFDNEDNYDEWAERDVERVYVDYYDLVRRSAGSGLFDIIGHPDLVKKFGHRPPPGSAAVRAAEEAMLEAVRAAGCALEASTAGLRKPVGEIYPHARILARAGELGIPIAFGSDAHAPGEVGHAMDDCLALLDACGIGEIATFRDRRLTLSLIREDTGA